MSETHGSHSKGVLKGRKFHQYTAKERETLIRLFNTDYHGENITQFCRDQSIPRLTFRGWMTKQHNVDRIHSSFKPTCIRNRPSTRPQLDYLLFDWFIDWRKRYATVPMTR